MNDKIENTRDKIKNTNDKMEKNRNRTEEMNGEIEEKRESVNIKPSINESIKLLLSFFTKIPINVIYSDLSDIARVMWVIPIVGFILGLIVSLFAAIVYTILPITLAGISILAFSIYLTGAHHTDGLLDFGDGIMAQGSPEKKIKVMHDVAIGAGGFILGFIIYLSLAFGFMSIFQLYPFAIITSFMGSRLSMMYACAFGTSANTQMADSFIKLNGKKEAIKSTLLLIVLILLTLLLWPIIIMFHTLLCSLFQIHQLSVFTMVNIQQFLIITPLAIILTSLVPYLSARIMINISRKHFNGLTGDCLGALNEIVTLIMLFISIAVYIPIF